MTLHVLADLEQGSQDWHDQRRGMVTASVVGRLIASRALTAIDYACPACGAQANDPCMSKVPKNAGAPMKTLHPERAAYARERAKSVLAVAYSDDAHALTMQLVAERITGTTDDTYVNNDMMRGVMCEPIARDAYSKHHAPVTEVGFMARDEDGWALGYSPDGLVGSEGLIEIKAPRAKTHIRTILADAVPAYNYPQCQAALLASGRDWLDFVSFYGGLPLFVKRVLPDPQWFAAIEAACRHLERTAAEMVANYNRAVVGLPATERIDYDLEVMVA